MIKSLVCVLIMISESETIFGVCIDRVKNSFYNELNTFIKEEINMDNTMNTEVEVTTEVSGEDLKPEIMIEESYGGPSKMFVGLVACGIAAVAIGATAAWKRHKKKKAEKAQEAAEEDFEDDDFYEEDLEAEEVTTEVVDETTEKKTGKK
nr:MAG TPA: ATPase [Caudoviricetes sp.]